jgi:hypothetical protein
VVARASSSAPSTSSRSSFAGQSVARISLSSARRGARSAAQLVYAVKDGTPLDRKLRVAVIGGGPSGACAAESLAKVGIETYLIERKMDNCKVSISAMRSGCMGCCGIAPTGSQQPMRSVGSGWCQCGGDSRPASGSTGVSAFCQGIGASKWTICH